MKKLIITAVATMFCIVASAATYNWTAKASWVSPDDDVGWSGNTVYAFDANAYSAATLLAALGTTGDAAFANALGSSTVDEEFTIVGSGLTDNGGTPKTASIYTVLVATGTDSKNYAYILDSAPAVTITDAIAGGAQAVFSFGDVVTGAAGGAGWTAVAPEPTSGLLLLLGMAGLALKRKRA